MGYQFPYPLAETLLLIKPYWRTYRSFWRNAQHTSVSRVATQTRHSLCLDTETITPYIITLITTETTRHRNNYTITIDFY